jgi:hypothetical protein
MRGDEYGEKTTAMGTRGRPAQRRRALIDRDEKHLGNHLD